MERHHDMQAPIPLPVNVDTTGAKILEDDASHPDQRDSRDIYLPNHVESVSHIAVDVGGSLAKVVYFTRSRSSSDPPPRTVTPPSGSKPSRSRASRETSPLPGPSNGDSSRFHSRQSSANGVGAHPLPPRSPASDMYSNHPTPSGTLTPTAILANQDSNYHHSHPAPLHSAMNAMRSSLLKRRSLPPTLPGGRLNFIKFETSDIESCISFLRELIESSARANNVTIEEMRRGVKLMATGGGAHMFYEVFEQELGVEVQKEDEMGCLITGLNFITLIPDEVFWYSDELVSALHSPLPHSASGDTPYSSLGSSAASLTSSNSPSLSEKSPQVQDDLPRPSPNPPLYAPMFDSNPTPKMPCLLVNIGSGVSIIKVDDYGKFERVSGTSLGGGTLWGLLSLLTDADSFDEMLELSERGDNSTVDMLVSDIYGQSGVLNAFGLKSSTIASSFGKVFRKNSGGEGGSEGRKKKFRPEDICKSLLYAVSNNIGQIAHMTAEKYDLDRIYFGGCFIRGHQATISTLSYAIRFWSKGTKRAFFLRHEGYLGAIGAWIKHLGDEVASPSAVTGHSMGQVSAASPPSPVVNGESSHRGEGTPAVADLAGEALSNVATLPSAGITPSTNLPARSLAASQDLPTPIAEAPESRLLEAEQQQQQQRTTTTTTTSAPIANGPTRNTDDLLSMLSELQVDHRELVEPIVNAQRASATPQQQRQQQQQPEVNGSNADGQDAVESEEDIAQLLAQLDAADGAADGLESRLDDLLGRLDGLLEGKGGITDSPEEAMRLLSRLNGGGQPNGDQP
ncbi:unnamed protein product [Sympodiomycopsis kandeliae]